MKLAMQVGLDPGHIVLDGDPASPPQRGTDPPIFGRYLLRPNGRMDQDATLCEGRPQPRRLRWGPSPLPKRGGTPNFRPISVMAKRLDGLMPLGMEVGFGPGDFVFDRDPANRRKKGTATTTQFVAHVHCSQTAGWIKMPPSMEVNVGPGDVVLHRVAALP